MSAYKQMDVDRGKYRHEPNASPPGDLRLETRANPDSPRQYKMTNTLRL